MSARASKSSANPTTHTLIHVKRTCLLRFCPERTHYFTRCGLIGVYRLWSSRTENNSQYFYRPGSPYRCHPRTHFVLGGLGPQRTDASGFRVTFEAQGLGAHVTRCTRIAAPRPRSTPLTSTRRFVSRRHQSHGDPRSRTGLQCRRSASGDKGIQNIYLEGGVGLVAFGLLYIF